MHDDRDSDPPHFIWGDGWRNSHACYIIGTHDTHTCKCGETFKKPYSEQGEVSNMPPQDLSDTELRIIALGSVVNIAVAMTHATATRLSGAGIVEEATVLYDFLRGE